MELSAVKKELIQEYFKTQPVLKAYLFGSYARREAGPESDIDILVDLDYTEKIGLKFFKMKFELEKLLNQKVDLISSKGISKHLEPAINKEKELIYSP